MKPKLIIWDWNGTILDDMEVCRGIANRMLSERGLKPFANAAEYKAVFGFPIKDYYRQCGYTYETESYETVADEFVLLYKERFPLCRLHARAVETLLGFKAAGIRQVLLSATKESQLKEQVAVFPELKDCFDSVLGTADHYAFSKAELAARFIGSCRLQPSEALFIGDTDHDYAVSHAVGAPCILFTGGHQSRARLEKTGAVAVVDSLTELKARLLSETL